MVTKQHAIGRTLISLLVFEIFSGSLVTLLALRVIFAQQTFCCIKFVRTAMPVICFDISIETTMIPFIYHSKVELHIIFTRLFRKMGIFLSWIRFINTFYKYVFEISNGVVLCWEKFYLLEPKCKHELYIWNSNNI